MGQVQRRAQREVELWELHEDERRNSRRRSHSREEERGGNGRSQRRVAVRGNENRSERRMAAAEDGRRSQVRNPKRSTENRNGNSAGRTGRNRTAQNAGGSRTGRKADPARAISLYEIERPAVIKPYPVAGERRRSAEHVYRGNARPVQSIRRRRARKRKEFLCRAAIVVLIVMCLALIYFITGQIYQLVHRHAAKPVPAISDQTFEEEVDSGGRIAPPEIIQDFLEVNDYSRPGTRLDRINSIFVHYTANPGTSAAQNRSYFANLAQTHERSASAHLIIGYEGELIQCIPFEEQAYAVMTRNEDSISIECCYLNEDGSFTQETYDTLIHTLAWLLEEYGLSTEDILRHYDCGGKLCPLYYAENEGAWEELRRDVAAYMAGAE